MNFDWLISWSAALFASVIGVGGDVNLAENKTPKVFEKVVEKKLSSKVATETDFVDELGGIYQGEFVPRENLLEMSKKKLTKEKFAKNLLEVVETKLPENFSYPPLKDAIKFRDISEKDEIFETAQKLKSLEILPKNNGFFGKPNEKNPEVKVGEMKQIMKRAFDENGDLNFLKDKDLDGVPNSLDACPDLPAPKGCPEPKEEDFPQDSVVKVSQNVKVVDQTEIQYGDKFSAIIFDQTTGEIFAESEQLTVTK